jgi:hydroxyacylglutathione hydrolase
MEIEVLKIDTPSLGDRSYLAHDGTTAVIVDPQRDIDRFNELLIKQNLKLGAVIETHIHNDYISGGLQLSREHGVPYLISRDDNVKFDRFAVVDQQEINVGSFGLKVRKTPGHTYNHLSYELHGAENKVVALFTGGSLLHGSTG